MKPSNCDLEDLWSGICFRYESRGQKVPKLWRAIYRLVHRLFAAGAQGRL